MHSLRWRGGGTRSDANKLGIRAKLGLERPHHVGDNRAEIGRKAATQRLDWGNAGADPARAGLLDNFGGCEGQQHHQHGRDAPFPPDFRHFPD